MEIASIRRHPFSSSRRRVRTRGLLLGALTLAAPSLAQQASSAQPVPATIANTPTKNGIRDALTDDPRLDTKVTLMRRDINLNDALQELSKPAQVRLATGGNELPHDSIIIAVKDQPLRDVLRAMTVFTEAHWRHMKTPDGQDTLTLMDTSDDPRYWDFLQPKTQAEADERRSVEDFRQKAARLSPDLQQALANDTSAPNDPLNYHVGIPLTSLPAEMQQDVRDALNDENQVLASRFPFPITKADITDDTVNKTRVAFKAESQGGETTYTIHLRAPWVPEGGGCSYQPEASLRAPIPDDPAARNETILPAGYHPGQWLQNRHQAQAAARDAARAKALKDDPRLSQSVSIRTDDASAGYPLAALAEAAHVNIVSTMLPETHTVSLTTAPLRDALDQIAAKYRGAWTEAADGTIVFYGRPPTAQEMMEDAAKRTAAMRERAGNSGR